MWAASTTLYLIPSASFQLTSSCLAFRPVRTGKNALDRRAIQENLDGRSVDWMEQVTEEQYAGSKTDF